FLFHQGDMGRGMYILVEGKVDIVLESAETREVIKTLATLEPGAYLGEVCMLSPQERTAGVRAETKVKLMYMDSRDFIRDVEERNVNALQISHNLALTLSDRLKRANEIVASLSITEEVKDDISGALF
nr:cyclic nucleotide-binding domain-containing protein [Pseudomonadota bacterium]